MAHAVSGGCNDVSGPSAVLNDFEDLRVNGRPCREESRIRTAKLGSTVHRKRSTSDMAENILDEQGHMYEALGQCEQSPHTVPSSDAVNTDDINDYLTVVVVHVHCYLRRRPNAVAVPVTPLYRPPLLPLVITLSFYSSPRSLFPELHDIQAISTVARLIFICIIKTWLFLNTPDALGSFLDHSQRRYGGCLIHSRTEVDVFLVKDPLLSYAPNSRPACRANTTFISGCLSMCSSHSISPISHLSTLVSNILVVPYLNKSIADHFNLPEIYRFQQKPYAPFAQLPNDHPFPTMKSKGILRSAVRPMTFLLILINTLTAEIITGKLALEKREQPTAVAHFFQSKMLGCLFHRNRLRPSIGRALPVSPLIQSRLSRHMKANPLSDYRSIGVRYGAVWKPKTLIERVQRAATKMIADLKSVDYETRFAVLDLFTLGYRHPRGDLIITCATFEQGLANRTLIERVQRAATKMIADLKSVDYETRFAVLDLFTLGYRHPRGDLIITCATFEQGTRRTSEQEMRNEDKKGHDYLTDWNLELCWIPFSETGALTVTLQSVTPVNLHKDVVSRRAQHKTKNPLSNNKFRVKRSARPGHFHCKPWRRCRRTDLTDPSPMVTVRSPETGSGNSSSVLAQWRKHGCTLRNEVPDSVTRLTVAAFKPDNHFAVVALSREEWIVEFFKSGKSSVCVQISTILSSIQVLVSSDRWWNIDVLAPEEEWEAFTQQLWIELEIAQWLSNGSVHAPSSDSVLGSPSSKDVERFNGLTEEDVKDKVLPDHLKEGLDIVIVGINPSLASASVGHHYAGPGNHFWTCISQAGLVPEMVTCYDDERMLDYGIGFTNVCTRPTKGAAELTRKEMKAGAAIMLEKMRKYRPKIAVFNGKGEFFICIYEAYVGHKNFSMGRQPTTLDGTDTTIFVMPSSSARCAQLPRAEDKLPFFVALRKLRDYIRGDLSELPDSEVVFADYTEFRVTQPDPKSLRKAERRRKLNYRVKVAERKPQRREISDLEH
ncbi:TDG/mug DNA glycosylase family protein [Clonorchis sinensis]|uniref:G/T mismatch-specific thymine DNA glycosylase n=1 Tax=Clonorchis sinensis TaxID=79923 RepID=G7YEE2_CLOSI|nr:TDG/mug DNA glycosylase family protein [Clonorchis sinensis]